MITKPCDRCQQVIEVQDNGAGARVECPHCGDMNIMPGVVAAVAAVAASPAPPTPSASAAAGRSRPEERGLPPDHGPEQRVRLVRPAWVRSRPIVFSLVVLVAAGGVLLGVIHLLSPVSVPVWLAVVSAIAAVAGIATLSWWWVMSLSAALEITNKRTVARKGLLSRSTSEVVHDNIRNVQVDQTFWERVWSVGSIGISSSGQDGIEIQMRHVPHPQELQQTIDLYRPLD